MTTTNLICEFCGAPIPPKQVLPKAYRLKYHAACKREVERLRHGSGSARHEVRCGQCGELFTAKRLGAKYCSPRCRTAACRAKA